MNRAKKPKQKTYTMTGKQAEELKRHITRDVTKRAMMVVLCAVVDEMSLDGDELERTVRRIDRYGKFLNDDKLIKMRDLADSIYKNTGVDFRSW